MDLYKKTTSRMERKGFEMCCIRVKMGLPRRRKKRG